MTWTRRLTALACWLLVVAPGDAVGPPGHGLEGRIIDAAGKPVAGVWVEARHASQGAVDTADFFGAPRHSMRTGINGEWSLSGLGEGSWIISAVASRTPHTDAELMELARPRAGEAPASDVAITRVFRNYSRDDADFVEGLDIRLAVGSTTEHPLAGRLTGAFDPQHFGYQVNASLSRTQTTRVGRDGASRDIGSLLDKAGAFSTVPAADGSFDFGGLDARDYDTLEVEACLLDGSEETRCRLLSTETAKLDLSQGGEITVKAAALVHLRVIAEGASPMSRSWGLFWWNEAGSGDETAEASSFYKFLPVGDYIFQARDRELASPHALVHVAEDTGADVTLELQPCPSFAVSLIDGTGSPLRDAVVQLAPLASAASASKLYIGAECRGGMLRLSQVVPGSYAAQVLLPGHEAFQLTLELKPDSAPIVVEAP